ncbi:MAG: nucleotidyltransferase domain-containing protein [Candidatus Bathyarchaeia archaeon]
MLNLPKLRAKAYEEALKKYLTLVLRDGRAAGLILYGSLAKGLEKPYPESDIDVLVVAESIPKDLFERRMMALKIKEDCLLIEDIWITPEELIDAVRGGWGLILDALEDGIVIYDRNGTIAEAKNILKSNYKRLGRIWILKT